jgi:hypothetical protein
MSLADDTAMPLLTGSQVQPSPTLSGMSGQTLLLSLSDEV